jgi:hypothetical protein
MSFFLAPEITDPDRFNLGGLLFLLSLPFI